MNVLERLERRFIDIRDDECWLTTYKTSPDNPYPRIDKRRALRIVWEAHNAEPIPNGLEVRHTCDNPACCNPHHLVLGTHGDNMRDIFERGGRSVVSSQRLSEDDYAAIAASTKTSKELATQYQVSVSHINFIRRNGHGYQTTGAE